MNSQDEGYPVHVRAFSQLLIRLRAVMGNDLDQALILAVIAERYYAALETENVAGAARERCAINAHSVALYAGIPRETVRRKIAKLVEKGWVDRDATGSLSPTARAADDLAAGTVATLTYMHSVLRGGRS